MSEYHKIQTLYLRDPANNHKTLLDGQFARPEFELLKDAEWVFTEKIDGTNIRVMWDGENVRFGGRTDRAHIPTPLLDHLMETFTDGVCGEVFTGPITLYGEGYGPKIQKGGGRYRSDPGFILFDALAGDVWLERDTVEDLASAIGCPVAPIVGRGTPADAVAMVRDGFVSEVAEDRTYKAEGLVFRPSVELRDRMGRRVISKLKHKDFR